MTVNNLPLLFLFLLPFFLQLLLNWLIFICCFSDTPSSLLLFLPPLFLLFLFVIWTLFSCCWKACCYSGTVIVCSGCLVFIFSLSDGLSVIAFFGEKGIPATFWIEIFCVPLRKKKDFFSFLLEKNMKKVKLRRIKNVNVFLLVLWRSKEWSSPFPMFVTMNKKVIFQDFLIVHFVFKVKKKGLGFRIYCIAFVFKKMFE